MTKHTAIVKKPAFDFSFISKDDQEFMEEILGFLRDPDLSIALDLKSPVYLHRWHVTQRSPKANTYLHVQVADDPERPLHDHPWDNMSVIISGGYNELLQDRPWPGGYVQEKKRKVGDVIYRPADQPHRLLLPQGTPYTMTIFSTGPHIRDWGFWCDIHGRQTWIAHADCVEFDKVSGRSIWKGPAFAR